MKKIPKKNYVILAILTVVTFLLVLYTNEWIRTYKLNKLQISPLTNNVNEVYSNELHMSLAETNQVILYVGYNHSKEVQELEKEILKTIKNKNINDYIIYYNVTDDSKYLDVLRKEFINLKDNINKAPMLIYVKNGSGVEVVDSKDNLIKSEYFKLFVDKYEIGN